MASPAEVRAVERFLRGAKLERPAEDLLESGVGSITQVRALIEACGRNLDRDFRDDRTLRDGLAAHWGPAHYRLRNRLPIRNPILEQIKARYAELFEAASAACRVVFPDLSVPEDEIGYLVLHFGSSSTGRPRIEKFRARCLCRRRHHSARMPGHRIRETPEIDIVANLSWST
jgi:mannitol operon transcriptional antiterminator